MADEMEALAMKQPGFIAVESARSSNREGITVSYWESEVRSSSDSRCGEVAYFGT
jgi:heme-degrading monooxygenase HmoA